jgi:hypothetical protein
MEFRVVVGGRWCKGHVGKSRGGTGRQELGGGLLPCGIGDAIRTIVIVEHPRLARCEWVRRGEDVGSDDILREEDAMHSVREQDE